MSAARSKNPNAATDEAPATVPQTTPSIGYGHPEYHFVQSISEIQKTLGEINSSIKTLDKTLENTKNKVDDLVKWKNMILGGAFVAGALISGFVFLLSKVSDYVTLKQPVSQTIQAAPQTTLPSQSTPPINKGG